MDRQSGGHPALYYEFPQAISVNIQGTQVRHGDVDDNCIASTCECTRNYTYKVSRSNDCGR